MSDSDSDSEYLDFEDTRCRTNFKNDTLITFHPSDELYKRWENISLDIKKKAGQRMKICAFWLPILLQCDRTSSIASWAVEIGLISSKHWEDLSLKHLHNIEILEAILRALDRGSLKKELTRYIFELSNMFNLRDSKALEEALYWLEQTGEAQADIRHRVLEFGHPHICHLALHLVFTEYATYVQDMSNKHEMTMKSLMARPSEDLVDKSEAMKKKGNENFQKQQYENAVKFYSEAINSYPDNHLIYGNRALCYIRCKQYLKAVGDGKRATLIKPLWAKGHYRYCEALFYFGEIKMAIEANKSAQSLCKEDHDGVKDLEQQLVRFFSEATGLRGVQPKNKRPGKGPQSKDFEVKKDNPKGKSERTAHAETGAKDLKLSKSEFSFKSGKGEASSTAKKKPKDRNFQSEDESLQNQKAADAKTDVCRELRSIIQDAHTALTDLRSRNAEQAFSQSLSILEANTAKELGLSTLDVLLLLYGRASALTEIGQPEELVEAQKLLEKIKSFEERTFQCLVYYAFGRVYLKENRFAVALEQLSDSLQMVKNHITPGKLTWPLTKEIVKETQPDYLKEILERAIELCKFPPIPDAICRLAKSPSHLKAEIYFTDPDFKGFIQICCCQSCTVEYHITCWKTLKTSTFFEKNEKDFLQEACLTPDCVGRICSIKIFGATGLVKCKFEAAVSKPQTPKKQKVNQKCTSLKKLKSKEERRLRRKEHKVSFHDKQTISDEILQQKEDSVAQSQQKVWLLYRDQILFQVSQNMELFREERGLHVSVLTSILKPWLELDLLRGNKIAERMLNWQQESLETLDQAVELLLERKNRVWARILIQLLSSCLDINPKLNNWACKLNDAGLNAAKSFIERYAEHLEQLNLDSLFSFSPLQEMILEKLGTKPELFSSIGLTVTEYLKQASPQDMRLFIWTLEEHRDVYLSCHTILDEYFDIMDGHCLVFKKSDGNQNNSPMKAKSRGRKKRLKGVTVWSGMRDVTPGDELDQDFFDDDSLSFLHPSDPFSVPSHLRDQVADFEDQYNSTRHTSHYKNILDNNPDPTKETLYHYFAQILEEHGPLVAEDPLLVGEVENFPQMAQLKIEEAGGFESFLLDSLRFIKMGKCIGLAKHAVSLQQTGHGPILDDLDFLMDPEANVPLPATDFPGYLDYSLAEPEVHSILPNPYVYDLQPAAGVAPFVGSIPGNDYFLPYWSTGDDSEHQSSYIFPNDYGELELNAHEVYGGVLEMDPFSHGVASVVAEESILKKHAEVQTCQETMRSVAVNTELHERFESCQGDINKKVKSNKKLEQQIKAMATICYKVDQKHTEDIASLEEDIYKITVNIQVTNKELALFQQKLEEEVKKDQKEKKANQEVLKSLKLETEKLVEENGSLTGNIREAKSKYEAKLHDFLELGNQSAAEKMSLEDEIKRCEALHISATRRSHTSQLSTVESSRDQGLYSLYIELADAKALLTKLDEVAHRSPSKDLDVTRNSWRANVQEVEKKIAYAETQYQEQINQVRNGKRISELLPLSLNQPEPAAAPPTAQTSHSTPSPVQLSAAKAAATPAQAQHKHPTKTLEPPHSTVFDKAMERLATIFPDYTRPELMRFVQQLRSSMGGSLGSMPLQDMVSGVSQLILDHQEKQHNSAKAARRGSAAQNVTPPFVAPVWQPVAVQRVTHASALNMEDPCIICHDDMSPDDIYVLACRHGFHDECIRSWLKEQSTCPTCRDHALPVDEFPVLSRRKRKAL
ncbi:E3 ubiquitin-protein ligase TTC3 isoform X2 [Mastacembelus armatus]|uniref:RING-type E3 ubiquitin transferase n=1 Tax=Mastacembelus armatus TaxID=205130 RepID=A0A3Q3MPW9_9TELE|nr:E3 ubiquitin-protein ligase TTC3 isoform X2 [Mastacembelus armatus]